MKHLSTFFTWAALLILAVFSFPGAEGVAHAAGDSALLPILGIAGLINIFDTRDMLAAVEQMKRPGSFLLDTFFPFMHQSDTATVDVDIIKGKRRMAPFVSPLAEGKVVERQGFSTNTLKPGYLKPKMPTTAEQLLKRQPGETLYAGQLTPADRAAAQLGKDLSELMDMVVRRQEWMAAQALNAGQVIMTIKGETADQSVTVDFQMSATHKVTLTGTDLWSDAASDPLADLQAWARSIRQDSGVNPTDVVMGADAAAAFINNPKVQKVLDMRSVDMGQINPRQLPNGVSYVGRLNAPGLTVEVWTYDEWYIDDTSGTETAMVPANKVWMGSRNAQNTKLYAAIQDVEAIEDGPSSFAVEMFPKSWVTKDPAVRWLMLQSAPLPALNQPDGFVSATVLA